MQPRVKICGLTRAEDVAASVAAGADALGFVFVKASPRFVTDEAASSLVRHVPAFVSRVGLFLNQESDEIRRILCRVPLSLLQFHGLESPEFCRQFGLPYIKAIPIVSPDSLRVAEVDFGDAAGILVDSHEPGGMGGTGKTVEWHSLSAGKLPLILAGGLTPENVAAAIRIVRPWAVDVSSGVEAAPGIKDAHRIQRFIEEAKSDNQS